MMNSTTKKLIDRVPLLNKLVALLKRIPLGKGQQFSLYDLLELYTIGIVRGALTYRASAISYSFFVAIFPFLLVVLNLIPYIPINDFQQDFWVFLDNLLPPGTHRFFEDIFMDIAGKKRAGLLSTVFILSIFLTTNGINAVFGGFEYSYHVVNTRGVVRQYFISMGVAMLLVVLILFSVIFWLAFEYIKGMRIFEFFEGNPYFFPLVKKIFFIFITYLSVSILFHFGSPQKGMRFFSAGSFLTLVLFILTTYGFGIYIENFAQYNQLYGSIGALLIFLLYIWLNATILLLGFELNASLMKLQLSSKSEEQKVIDTNH
ncbi:membrane protein [Capnocytophaga granulosa]|uniref:Membrane protein n=1 Tax=Capnocytophaga granulosa TaxID=45242 RepID=A0A1H2TSM0_9FLAO|nr:YihY/virulence factor BrkB family protein [Capnocytophaga granulosa]EPD28979.1 YihY family inner membrane protein [Capnocytophaga granulosa ATCC 51502]SDW46870.1 membrane protein [Capnocytophaga granulosa]SUX15990.1 YihY family inner membrane protein [Capnocytophaga granulosa]